ncbi:MAG: hypothetical protein ACJA1X_002194 [Bermanella sp.]|jgi:hypothetical protein
MENNEGKTTAVLQTMLGDVHSFDLNNYQYHIKKSTVHNGKHNGKKGCLINIFDYCGAGA